MRRGVFVSKRPCLAAPTEVLAESYSRTRVGIQADCDNHLCAFAEAMRFFGRLLVSFALFIHVLDRGFVNHQICCANAVDLEAGAIVPLDDSVNFLAIR